MNDQLSVSAGVPASTSVPYGMPVSFLNETGLAVMLKFRARAQAMGLPAWSLDANGNPVESGGRAPASIVACSLAFGAGQGVWFDVEIDRWLAVVRHAEGRKVLGWTVVDLGMGFERREDAEKLAGALRLMAQDLAKIDESERAAASFTLELSNTYDTVDVLFSVGRSMRAPAEPGRFFQLTCDKLNATMPFTWVAAWFVDSDLVPGSLRGLSTVSGPAAVEGEEFRSAAEKMFTMARGAEKWFIQDNRSSTVPSALATAESPQVLVQPLFCKDRPIGVLMLGGKTGADLDISSYDIQLVESTAGYLEAFLDTVALYADQNQLFLGTLSALTASIDAKDRYTCGHSERVAHFSQMLALASGYTVAEAERIRICGLVHDVGKIGVPEAVLLKPGKLTDEEFAAIKTHPEIGYRILKDIPLLADVLPGVLHHHERYDGRGYPHKLAGEDIPLQARIVAVADTFDAMSSNRSYRSARTREEVLTEIERCAGTQLDARLAKLVRGLDLTEYDAMLARAASQVGIGLAA